jgi:hypothetical protein
MKNRIVFEWDEGKNEKNIIKHGLDFNDASEMFRWPLLVDADDRANYREDRHIGIGKIKTIIAVAVFAQSDSGLIRIISLRKATRYERDRYFEEIKD